MLRAIAPSLLCVWLLAVPNGTARADMLTVAAIGTSLTRNAGWLMYLRQHLPSCFGGGVAVEDYGRAAATSRWGRSIAPFVASHRPDIVLLEFAVNDSVPLRGEDRDSAARSIADVVRSLRAANSSVRIVLLAMNPVWGLRGTLRPRLDLYNDDYRPIARRLGLDFLDLRPVWMSLDPAKLARAIPDGVHPTQDAASSMAGPAIAAHLGCPQR